MNGDAGAQSEPTPTVEWARVEIFGHRCHYGRIREIERFGAKFLRVDVIGTATDEPLHSFDYAGASIFSLTPMTEEAARKWAEQERPRPYTPMAQLPFEPADTLDDLPF